jgi:hypothetical protein
MRHHFLVLGSQSASAGVEPIGKELQFFTCDYARGERRYRSHFPYLRPGEQTFEATPYYLFHPEAAARAASMLPRTKFLVLLRDPVDRAYSHYLHSCAIGSERLTFEDALAAEPTRLADARSRGLDSRVGRRIHRDFSYAARGLYAPQLERWLEHVPRDRMIVLRSERLHENPTEVYAELFRYLELSVVTPQRFAEANMRSGREDAPQLNPKTRASLRSRFAEDSARVSEMLQWEQVWS